MIFSKEKASVEKCFDKLLKTVVYGVFMALIGDITLKLHQLCYHQEQIVESSNLEITQSLKLNEIEKILSIIEKLDLNLEEASTESIIATLRSLHPLPNTSDGTIIKLISLKYPSNSLQ